MCIRDSNRSITNKPQIPQHKDTIRQHIYDDYKHKQAGDQWAGRLKKKEDELVVDEAEGQKNSN